MRKFLSWLSVLTLTTCSFSTVIACDNSPNHQDDDTNTNAYVDTNDNHKIIIVMKKGTEWDAKKIQGVTYNNHQLDQSSYYLVNEDGKHKLILNFQIYQNSQVIVNYDKTPLTVDVTSAGMPKWNSNETAMINKLSTLEKNGLTFDSFYSASDFQPNYFAGATSVIDYINNYYVQPFIHDGNYQVTSFIADKDYFKPITTKLVGNIQKYQPGAYKFFVFNKQKSEYVGNFPFTINFNIKNYQTDDVTEMLDQTDTFLTTLGSFQGQDLLNLLDRLGLTQIIDQTYPCTQILDFIRNFGKSLDEIFQIPSVKEAVKNFFGSDQYFDLSTLLDTTSVVTDTNGNNYYKVNNNSTFYLNKIVALAKSFGLDLNQLISIPRTIDSKTNNTFGYLKITGSMTFNIRISELLQAILPDVVHFLNFFKEKYLAGNHNIFLLFLQYLLDGIHHSTKGNLSYENDHFDLINHYYDNNNNLQSIEIAKSDSRGKSDSIITNNIGNLLFDVLSLQVDNANSQIKTWYTSWGIASKNKPEKLNYVYLYEIGNSSSLVSASAFEIKIKVDIDLHEFWVVNIKDKIDASTLNYKIMLEKLGCYIYSIRYYIFDNIYQQLLTTAVLTDPNKSIILRPVFNLFSNFNLSQDKKWDMNFIGPDDLNLTIFIYAKGDTNFSVDLSDKNLIRNIPKQIPQKILISVFQDYLRNQKTENQILSNDVIDSMEYTSNDLSGDIYLELYNINTSNWEKVTSKNISTILLTDQVSGLRIAVDSTFDVKSNFESNQIYHVTNKHFAFDPTINVNL